MTYMWNLKKIQQTNEYNKKETDRYRGLTSDYQQGKERWRDTIGVGDKEVQTIMYRINKLQAHTVQHREYSQQFTIIINGI